MVGISLVTNENCYHDKFMLTAKIFQWHGASGCHMFKENAKVLVSFCCILFCLVVLLHLGLVTSFPTTHVPQITLVSQTDSDCNGRFNVDAFGS